MRSSTASPPRSAAHLRYRKPTGCSVDGFFPARMVAGKGQRPGRLPLGDHEGGAFGDRGPPPATGRHRPRRADCGREPHRWWSSGHGIGTSPVEDPQVPNYGPGGKGKRLVPHDSYYRAHGQHAGPRAAHDWTAAPPTGLVGPLRAPVAITVHGPWILPEPHLRPGGPPAGAVREGGRWTGWSARPLPNALYRGAAHRARGMATAHGGAGVCPACGRGRGGRAHALRHDPRRIVETVTR
jgi:hypothetical protein